MGLFIWRHVKQDTRLFTALGHATGEVVSVLKGFGKRFLRFAERIRAHERWCSLFEGYATHIKTQVRPQSQRSKV